MTHTTTSNQHQRGARIRGRVDQTRSASARERTISRREARRAKYSERTA